MARTKEERRAELVKKKLHVNRRIKRRERRRKR